MAEVRCSMGRKGPGLHPSVRQPTEGGQRCCSSLVHAPSVRSYSFLGSGFRALPPSRCHAPATQEEMLLYAEGPHVLRASAADRSRTLPPHPALRMVTCAGACRGSSQMATLGPACQGADPPHPAPGACAECPASRRVEGLQVRGWVWAGVNRGRRDTRLRSCFPLPVVFGEAGA